MTGWAISDLVFLFVAAIAGTAFMVIYTVRTPWWREEHRAHLGFFTLTLTLMLWLYVLRALVDPATFVIMRRAFFDLVALEMVWRLVLLRSRSADRVRNGLDDVRRDVP